MKRTIILLATILLLAVSAFAQIEGRVTDAKGNGVPKVIVTATGEDGAVAATVTTDPEGNYAFEELSPGKYKITAKGTAGQPAAGTNMANAPYNVKSGYWAPGLLPPTAANVAISGQVMTTDGRGLRNAVVSLTDMLGITRTALTSSFGYYRFDNVQAGETYIIGVSSKRYQFTPQTVSVSDDLTGLDLVAESGATRKEIR